MQSCAINKRVRSQVKYLTCAWLPDMMNGIKNFDYQIFVLTLDFSLRARPANQEQWGLVFNGFEQTSWKWACDSCLKAQLWRTSV